ncbi:MAG: sulfate ABC transporter ATP-binding protein [Caulobacteraceae bacterium]|nr:sulfate ABC transporter ATP-binding protein [Caulobacteraceae bacterium]
MSLIVDGVAKRFARFPALNGVSLSAEPGEFLALLGPSGSGKTTLLRVLAGLETPDSGKVLFEGEDFLALSARERRIGMVFQHYALFRHMTVARNIAFGLRARPARQRPPHRQIEETVERLLALVQLEGLGGRYPAQLSGGQQQRVALARALAIEPRMLLLDEPFGALDAKVRKELRQWLRRVHDETGVTTLFVTHDQEEAIDLADRVAILRNGLIEQIGTPEALEAAPASAFVFDFLGDSNRLPCRLQGDLAIFDGFAAPAVRGRDAGAGATTAWFRPHETSLGLGGAGLAVTISDILTRGSMIRVECRGSGGVLFEADYPRDALPTGLAPAVEARLAPRRVFVFAGEAPEATAAQASSC